MKRLVALVMAAIASGVALSGCAGPYTTPQSTFAIHRDAVARKDWPTALGCLTTQSQDKVIAGLVVAIATASIVSNDAAAVLEKHGVDRKELMGNVVGGALSNLMSPREAVEKGMGKCLEKTPDKSAFFTDGMSWLEANNKRVADKLMLAAGAIF